MEKGKLYITFAPSLRGNSPEHTDVYHGVKNSNVENLINKKKNRTILASTFISKDIAKPMKQAMLSNHKREIDNSKGLF